ncbi:MAG: hypothetical protein RLY93_10535 [Sumerlaeia bacterium]
MRRPIVLSLASNAAVQAGLWFSIAIGFSTDVVTAKYFLMALPFLFLVSLGLTIFVTAASILRQHDVEPPLRRFAWAEGASLLAAILVCIGVAATQ